MFLFRDFLKINLEYFCLFNKTLLFADWYLFNKCCKLYIYNIIILLLSYFNLIDICFIVCSLAHVNSTEIKSLSWIYKQVLRL